MSWGENQGSKVNTCLLTPTFYLAKVMRVCRGFAAHYHILQPQRSNLPPKQHLCISVNWNVLRKLTYSSHSLYKVRLFRLLHTDKFFFIDTVRLQRLAGLTKLQNVVEKRCRDNQSLSRTSPGPGTERTGRCSAVQIPDDWRKRGGAQNPPCWWFTRSRTLERTSFLLVVTETFVYSPSKIRHLPTLSFTSRKI